jgi:hypothetical protein
VQKQGGQVVDLVQKTFRECTIADEESDSQGIHASLTCDLQLHATNREIARDARIHTQGLSPTKTHKNLGTVP